MTDTTAHPKAQYWGGTKLLLMAAVLLLTALTASPATATEGRAALMIHVGYSDGTLGPQVGWWIEGEHLWGPSIEEACRAPRLVATAIIIDEDNFVLEVTATEEELCQ